VDNAEAAKVLLFQLAFENANSDCQAVLLPIKGKATDVEQYIKLCQNVGTETHKASMLAATLSQLQVNKNAIKCFNRGQEGHISKDCPKKRQQPKKNKCPTQLCPRCQKGYHWSNHCKSKYDKFGQPLLGNGMRGTQPGVPQTNRVWNTSQI
ncbi:GAK5 protein, partial [Nyctiprogne leucopyga]|nr:GAK5 protein [Nyctiprogne leucopyga]